MKIIKKLVNKMDLQWLTIVLYSRKGDLRDVVAKRGPEGSEKTL